MALILPSLALAEPLFNQPASPYEPNVLDSVPGTSEIILGSLYGDPHLFEFTLEATSSVSLQLSQSARGEISPLTILLIRVEPFNRGVSEVGRVSTPVSGWSDETFSSLGLTLRSNQILTEELAPGRYRFEVSSPDNNGNYLLRFKVETTVEPSLTLREAREVRRFLGYQGFTIIFSSRVFWPLLGMVVLLGLAWFGYRRFKTFKTLSQE